MFESAEIPNWLVIIYERYQRLNRPTVDQMVGDFVRGCNAVGKTLQASLAAARLKSIRHQNQPQAGAREMGIGPTEHWSCESSHLLPRRWLTFVTATQCRV
jgi:hypothetical protein